MAIPPAEDPDSTTLFALDKLKVVFKYLKWDLVFKLPRKYSNESLNFIGSFAYPWWKKPSQYNSKAFVHPAKIFFVLSVDNIP